MEYFVPDIPQVVITKMKRNEYFERLDNGEIVDEPEADELTATRMRQKVRGSCFC